MNVSDPIRRLARLIPAATVVVRADNSVVSYRDFDRMIDAAATHLSGLGLIAGQTAGLAMTGPDELPGLVVGLALARLGVASADLSLPPALMDVCIPEGGRAGIPGVRTIPIEKIWAAMPKPDADVPPVQPHPDGSAVFRMFASSGTTGTPKLIAVSHDLMQRRAFLNAISMGNLGGVHISAVGMGSAWGLSNTLRTIAWAGGTLVLTNPDQAADAIRRHKVSSMAIAPISLQRVVTRMPDGASPPPSLNVIEVAGSALPPRLHELVHKNLCGHVVSYFGAIEAGGIASAPMSTLAGFPGAAGYVHSGVEVEAVGDDGTTLPPGAEGILRIRGSTVVPGYAGDPAASEEVFKDGWFYCGDVGSVSGDGLLTISGRSSDFINSGGNKLSPRVVEDVLLSLPQVTEAAAFGVPDRMGVVQIWAAIVATEQVELSVLNAICRERLAEKRPKFILQVKGLPRNANGKVAREELIKFAAQRQP